MHDLEYAYVKIEPLVWTPELIAQFAEEMDRGLKILNSHRWNGEQWVEAKKQMA